MSLQLEDLYVTPEYRGSGVGKALFGELGRVARENDCARVDWAVLKVSCSVIWTIEAHFHDSGPPVESAFNRLLRETLRSRGHVRMDGDEVRRRQDSEAGRVHKKVTNPCYSPLE